MSKGIKVKMPKNATKLPRAVKRLFPEVTKAVDSVENITVVVSRRDCKEGTKKDPNQCAMARAMKREYKADGAIIGLSYSYLIKGNTATRFKTPDSVQREIISFDRHQDFYPGTYELNKVPPQNRLGVKHEQKRGNGNPIKDVKKIVHRTGGVRVLPHGSDY